MRKLRIAVIGDLPQNNDILGNLDDLLRDIQGCVSEKDDTATQILISSLYGSCGWSEWCRDHSCEVFAFNSSTAPHIPEADYEWTTDTRIRAMIGTEMCRKADVSVAVWNEDPSELSGAVWEYIQTAHDMCAPCIWISSVSGNTYCVDDPYYMKYDPEYLKRVSDNCISGKFDPMLPPKKEDPITAFWKKRRAKYLKKHNAADAEFPFEDDIILKNKFVFENDIAVGIT